MQIHELNPFQGTLGSEAFLVVDNGDDTGKISVERLTQPINDRIDDIITSPAPTEQEIIDARRGWNEVVYGSLGTAIRSQVKQILAQFYKFNTYDLLAVYGTPISRTRNGVTFTWDEAGQVCEVSGEAVGGDAYASIYTQTGAWQGIFERGVTYTVGYETTDPNVKLRIAVWEGVETTPDYYYFDENGHFGIPPEAAKIGIDLYVASGDSVSAVVKNVYMLRTYTAKEVTATIRDAMIGADLHMYNSLGDAIREQLNGKVDKVTGKVLSTNDFTDAEKTKLSGIEAGSEVNAIEAIKLDGTELTPDANRAVNIPVDETLTVEGVPADAKTVGEELENKLAIDGYSELATVGNAEQLVATQHVTDTEPYIYRKTGGPNDVGDRVYDTIVGGSVVWNQLVDSGALEVIVPNGHKYYANINGTKSIGASTGTAISINDSTKDNVIDLTAALGSTIADYVYSLETATAGAGVAWFKKYFPGIYYGYTEPHFEHVQVSAKETIGFNRLPQNLKKVTGTPAFDESKVSRVISGQTYQLTHGQVKNATSWRHGLYCYDLDGNSLFTGTDIIGIGSGGLAPNSSGHYYVNSSNGTRTAEKFTANFDGYVYCSIGVGDTTSSTEALESCLHLTGDRDGEYEPYKKRTYPLDSSLTLRGIPKLDSANRLYFDGDVYQHDGTVTRRYGIVDLGTLTYNKQGSTSEYPYGYFHCGIPGKKGGMTNFVVEGYTVVPTYGEQKGSVGDKTVAGSPGNTSVFFINAVYASYTVEQIKSAMSGVYLIYELATETTETAEPFQSPMVVDPLGTEEFVDYGVEQGTRDVAIPVGHNSEYPADLRGKLQHLPSLSTSGDGRYVVVQAGNQMTLSPDTSLGLIAALEARVAALEGGNG